MLRVSGVLAAALAVIVSGGCGRSGDSPPIASASGVVTLDGRPLEDARVIFHPVDESARYSHATTDAQGRFRMSTFGMNDGALVGRHKVVVSKVDMPEEARKIDVEALKKGGYAGGAMAGYEGMMGIGGKTVETTQQVPAKYSDKASTTIELEVVAGQNNEFPISLDSQ